MGCCFTHYVREHHAGTRQALILSPPVKEFLDEHPDIKFIDREIFFACFHQIKPWLNISTLVGYMMKYGLVKTSSDMEELTSSYFKPQDKINSLMRMVEANGTNGCMLLYMCLKESSTEAKGHEDAIKELNHCGKYPRTWGGVGGGGGRGGHAPS
jgi:hypothetical protein